MTDVTFGLALAVASSLLWAVVDGVRKALATRVPPESAALAVSVGSVPLLGAAAAWAHRDTGWAPLDAAFLGAVAASIAINVVTTVTYARALRTTPLSLTIPYLSLSTVFMLVTSAVINGEAPNGAGLAGVFAVALGALLLNPGAREDGWRGPWRALRRSQGSLAMLGVAVLWALSAPLDKVGIQHASAPVYGFVLQLGIAMGLVARHPGAVRPLRHAPGLALLAGVLVAVALSLQFWSLEYVLVAYTIAIKRAGMLGSIAIGACFFGEGDLGRRLFGGAIMAGGVAAILLGR